MQAFRNGFITVEDLTKRGIALPAELEASQQNLQDQIQIRPLSRQQQVGALGAELAIQPKRASNALAAEDLKGRQITEAGRQLPTENEASADNAGREKKAQFFNALNSTVPGVREQALATASTEAITDAWTTSHGQPPPEVIELPGTNSDITPKPIEDWVIETYGQSALAGDAQAVLNKPEVQQGYNAYVAEAKSRPLVATKGTPEYTQALKKDLETANLKSLIQGAELKALPGVLEQNAKNEAETGKGAFAIEHKLVEQRNQTLKQFRDQAEQYAKIAGLRDKPDPNNSDDLALIYAYVKLLDPGSVVREGEIKLAQAATPLTGKLVQKYNILHKSKNGILDPNTRKDYLSAAELLFKGASEAARPEVERVSGSAEAHGILPERVLNSTELGLMNPAAPKSANTAAGDLKVGDTVTLKDGRKVKVKTLTANGFTTE